MKKKLLEILPLVSKPSRYIGAEINSYVKDPEKASLRVALCFPDVYEVGISHLGLKVLYEALNRRGDIYAERAYAPWQDMEDMLKAHGLPLSTVETFTPLSRMDVVGFTLQYELSYTNVLNMLALSGIPLLSRGRGPEHPLVIAGGPCAFNPEPLADFMDAFVIGDAEEAVLEVSDAVIGHRKGDKPGGRAGLLMALSKIEGVYVPSHFEVVRGVDGRVREIRNIAGGQALVRKRTLSSLETAVCPDRPLLPYMPAVHNRVTLEVARGCTRGCRFCQAGYIYRPVRERSVEKLTALAGESIRSTGYDELSLSSLSTGDYSGLLPLMKGLMDRFSRSRVSISLPSLRVGTLTKEMCQQIKRVRKTGFTIAPEAGTQRLRDVINKNITEESLLETAGTVFSEGWDLIKLYFMVGLPTETDEDVEGIIALSRKVLDAGRKAGGRRKSVNVGVSAFVPKPHTPFQWQGQIPLAEIRRKKDMLSRVLGKRPFAFKSGFAEMSVLEAAFARGGREVGRALLAAWEGGARFDGWTERFDYPLWLDAFKGAGLDLEACAARDYGMDETLPWDHIDTGVTGKFLKKEYERAVKGETTPDCRAKCAGCGLKCRDEGTEASVAAQVFAAPDACPETRPPAGRPAPSARVRFKYAKLMPLALLSHAELMIVFFRAISRAGLPILFSEGFNPHPKVSFGPALAVGIESEAEILDMELSYTIDLLTVVKALNAVLPPGIRIIEARSLRADEHAPGADITRFTYEAWVPEGFRDDLTAAVQAFLKSDRAIVRRVSDKGEREIDIRPMVRELAALGDGLVRFTLQESDGRSAKPYELVQALFGLTPQESRTVKLKRITMA